MKRYLSLVCLGLLACTSVVPIGDGADTLPDAGNIDGNMGDATIAESGVGEDVHPPVDSSDVPDASVDSGLADGDADAAASNGCTLGSTFVPCADDSVCAPYGARCNFNIRSCACVGDR